MRLTGLYRILVATLILFACSKNEQQTSSASWQRIYGRDENAHGPLYQVKAPLKWIRCDPILKESLHNTMEPLCEYKINDSEGDPIRISIHNFPSKHLEDRIPPSAQIARWKQQFDYLDPISVVITPQAFGGFSGFLFEGSGILKGKRTTVIGWSMQLTPELYRRLEQNDNFVDNDQMRSDYTIKAQGDPNLIAKYKQSIIAFGRSFELIRPITSNP